MDRRRCCCEAGKLRAMRHEETDRTEARGRTFGPSRNRGTACTLGNCPLTSQARPASGRAWCRIPRSRRTGWRPAPLLHRIQVGWMTPRTCRGWLRASRLRRRLRDDTAHVQGMTAALDRPGLVEPREEPAHTDGWSRPVVPTLPPGKRTASNKKRGPKRVCPLWRTALNTTILRRPSAASSAGRTGQDRCAKRGATSV